MMKCPLLLVSTTTLSEMMNDSSTNSRYCKYEIPLNKCYSIRNFCGGKFTCEREMCEYKYDNDDENICVNVKLKISKNAEYRVYDEFQDAEKTADGDFIVNMSYPENEWLYGYIMSFGEYAEVLEPTYIRDIIKTKIEKMINNYL